MKLFKKQLSLLLALIIGIGVVFSGGGTADAASYYGNTNSNIKNGGQAVRYNSTTYSVSHTPNYKYEYSDDGLWPWSSYTIYKEDSKGKHVKAIATNAVAAPSLNAKSGWLYYVGISSKGNTGIYKVKTDGTKRTWITSISMRNYRGALVGYKPMILKDSYLYYLDGSRTIRRISTSGNYRKTIYTSKYYTGDFSISGDYMYVMNETNASYWPGSKDTITRVRTDGKYAKQIARSTSSGNNSYMFDMVYYKGYIFYQNDYGIYRMKTDGSSKKAIIKLDDMESYAVYDSKIYYMKNGSLMRCNLDGSKKTTLKRWSGRNSLGCITNSKIYLYIGQYGSYPIYDIKTKNVYYPN